jgi:leucyl-tRNA synthetase
MVFTAICQPITRILYFAILILYMAKKTTKEYDHLSLEKKVQKEWDAKKIYKTESTSKKKPYYVLDMFPYPSGAGLHVGHPRGYIGSDVFARFKRMNGFNVLHPMGFDSFGLPAEQYAIKTGKHPGPFTDTLVKQYKKQLDMIGFSYDWSRMITTHSPEYYKFTQEIFLKIYNSFFDTKKQRARHVDELIKIFEKEGNSKVNDYTTHGEVEVFSKSDWKNYSLIEKQDILMKYRLAYEGFAEVNWCEELGTVLANDEIIDTPKGSVSERGEYTVTKKNMRQWFMRITAYADRLLEGLDLVDFENSTKEIQKNWIGKETDEKGKTTYNMRDAIFARQRYWGEPIPLIHDKNTGLIKEVPLSKLPLKLPNVKSYTPSGTGESPLASVKAWRDAGYETNTMPGWAASSWYFLRYLDPKNKKKLVDEKVLSYWSVDSSLKTKNLKLKTGLVDMYIGGTEHNTGHLLYARFWHKVLFDLGVTKTQEPFKALRHQGMIGGADGRKMSKRWGNVINPDDVVKTYGADTLRIFEMFLGPFDAHLPWSEDGIIGSRRFVERVWRVSHRVGDFKASPTDHVYSEFEKILHKTIKKVTDDIEAFAFNTAISSLMICLNSMEKQEVLLKDDFKKFLQILAPFAPHMTDELWHVFGEKTSVHLSPWPTYNPKFLIESKVTIGIQVNGKVRGEVTVEKDMKKAGIQALVLLDENVQKYVTGPIKKFIYIPGKIISIVV